MADQCKCLDTIDEKLKEKNVRIQRSFVLTGPNAGMYPVMHTELIEKVRGKKAPVLFPTYCPFCGVKYAKDQENVES